MFELLPMAQAQPAAPPPFATMLPILILFFIFYFLIFRPQRQKQEEHKKMVAALQKNSEVVTIGGIHGTVVNVKQATVVLRVADNVKIEIQKSAIAGLKKDAPEAGIEEKK